MAEDVGRVLVVVPTYNEAASMPVLLGRLRTVVPTAHVLVVDDASPDGTGDLADTLAAEDEHVHVLHRAGKEGLGAAYRAGFAWGLDRGYDTLVQMDADGSHLPEQLPALLRALAVADLVIGSRWTAGGSVQHWSRHREALSRGGNLYTRLAIGTGVRDATAGFRAWRRDALLAIGHDTMGSGGYCFQVDLTRRAARAGLRTVEVPIRFVERTQGESKMTPGIVGEALWRVTAWGVQDRWARVRRRTGKQPGVAADAEEV